MGVGVSIFLITLGAIFKFAIKGDLVGDTVDLHAIGVILMIVGGATFLLQLLLMSRSRQSQNDRERLFDGDNPPQI